MKKNRGREEGGEEKDEWEEGRKGIGRRSERGKGEILTEKVKYENRLEREGIGY